MRDRSIGAGYVCLAVGAAAGVWHFFASQSPSSPFHVAFLPGPIQRFAFWALAMGIVLLVVGARGGKWLLVATAFKLSGLFLGAAWSVYGVQIIDPRPTSVTVMALRLIGDGILVVVLFGLALEWLRGRQRS